VIDWTTTKERFGYDMHRHLLIECQGDYWHSLDKARRNDRAKFTYMDRYFPEYEIMYIWEHEFYSKDGVLDRLRIKMGADIRVISFEFGDVEIKEVKSSDIRSFLDAYHYIGRGRGGKCFGAFLGGTLIACVVLSSPSRNNGSELFGDNYCEVSRFCIHPAYHKKNFGSWLLSRVLRTLKCDRVVAYTDTTVGHTGILYKANNFKLHHTVPADYWYVGPGFYVMHKQTLYKRARAAHMTESEFAGENSYVKRYGGNKLCFVRDLNAA